MQIGTIKLAGRNAANYTFNTEVWLLCNGQNVLQLTYPALFALIGATYGAAPVGQFKLPNYGLGGGATRRMPVGTSLAGYALAGVAGVELHHHHFGIGTPDIAHGFGGDWTGTESPGTVNVDNPAIIDRVSGVLHAHIRPQIFDHVIAGSQIDDSAAVSPMLGVGFYIRGL